MRAAVLLLALLQSASLAAQPILSEEVVSDPLSPHVANTNIPAPAVAMAEDSRGVAIAWSMPNADGVERVYVARLDATAHVQGGIRELPVIAGTKIDALNPSIAAAEGGHGFVVGFLQAERGSSNWTAAYEQLDGDLSPSAPAALQFGVSSPVIARSGSATWLTVDGGLWRIRADGSSEKQRATLPAAIDMAVIGSDVRTVGTHTVQRSGFQSCNPYCPTSSRWFCPLTCQVPYPPVSDLEFTQLNSGSDPISLPFPNNMTVKNPAVQGDGRVLLVAWFEGRAEDGGYVRAARMLEPAPIWPFSIMVGSSFALGPYAAMDAGPTVTSIATDGRRFVIVWRTVVTGINHDVRGAIVDEDGAVTPLQIASTPADELDPSVIATRPGEFLIAYEKDSAGERRIAGKLLTFPVRRRAVR